MKKLASRFLIKLYGHFTTLMRRYGLQGDMLWYLPPNIKMSDAIPHPDMRFAISLGFDVSVDKNSGHMGIHMNNMVFASDGQTARDYIEQADPKLAKDIASLLTLVASKQILLSPADSYSVAALVDDPAYTAAPIDPKLLN